MQEELQCPDERVDAQQTLPEPNDSDGAASDAHGSAGRDAHGEIWSVVFVVVLVVHCPRGQAVHAMPEDDAGGNASDTRQNALEQLGERECGGGHGRAR